MDEGRFGLKPCLGRHWSLKGRRPTALVRPGYSNFYLFTSVCPSTGQEFTLELPYIDTEMMQLYLDHFRAENPGAYILLVLDRAGWHVSASLRVPEGMELLPLPPYSPELNPVERLWQWLRRHACRNRIFRSLDELSDAITVTWQDLSSTQIASICRCNYM